MVAIQVVIITVSLKVGEITTTKTVTFEAEIIHPDLLAKYLRVLEK